MGGSTSRETPPSFVRRRPGTRTCNRFFRKLRTAGRKPQTANCNEDFEMPRTRSLAWSELKIGVMAVAALALTALLVVAVGGASGFAWERYNLKTSFDNVQGLKSGAIVRIAGVEVGKVTKVELAGAGVDVHLSIKK